MRSAYDAHRRVPERGSPPSETRTRIVARARAAADIGAATARVPWEGKRIGMIDTFAMFVGYPRSGHSLVGSLLDAHPDIVLSHELDVLKYLQTGVVGRRQLFSLILRQERRFHDTGRAWTGYDYAVPGQWQGRTERPRVIGDKKGGASTLRLAAHPDLLRRLADMVGVDVRLIHVIRNPFDNIATMHLRGHGSVRNCIDAYFAACHTNAEIRAGGVVPVVDLKHEDLLLTPEPRLEQLCRFLGVGIPPGYLDACSSVVFASPHRSRHDVAWTQQQIKYVNERAANFDFLQGYAFDS